MASKSESNLASPLLVQKPATTTNGLQKTTICSLDKQIHKGTGFCGILPLSEGILLVALSEVINSILFGLLSLIRYAQDPSRPFQILSLTLFHLSLTFCYAVGVYGTAKTHSTSIHAFAGLMWVDFLLMTSSAMYGGFAWGQKPNSVCMIFGISPHSHECIQKFDVLLKLLVVGKTLLMAVSLFLALQVQKLSTLISLKATLESEEAAQDPHELVI